jgi:hypothetical protein
LKIWAVPPITYDLGENRLTIQAANLENATVNFSAQSPMGEGCTAVFSEIGYTAVLLKNIRNGT